MLDSILKFWLDFSGFDAEQQEEKEEFFKLLGKKKKSLLATRKKQFGLELGLLRSLKWSSEHGYRGAFRLLINNFQQVRGSMISYAKRSEMLGRKVNFRRKVKKKAFEEY